MTTAALRPYGSRQIRTDQRGSIPLNPRQERILQTWWPVDRPWRPIGNSFRSNPTPMN